MVHGSPGHGGGQRTRLRRSGDRRDPHPAAEAGRGHHVRPGPPARWRGGAADPSGHYRRAPATLRRRGTTAAGGKGKPARPDLATASPEELAGLLAWLEHLAVWHDECGDHDWMHGAWEAMAGGRSVGRLDTAILRPLLDEADRLAALDETLAIQALELPEIDEPERLGKALDRLAAGKSAFGLLDRFATKPAKAALDGVGSPRPNRRLPRTGPS